MSLKLMCLTSLENSSNRVLLIWSRLGHGKKKKKHCMARNSILYTQTLYTGRVCVQDRLPCSFAKPCCCTCQMIKDAFTSFCLNEPSKCSPGGYHGNARWHKLRRHRFHSLVVCTWCGVQGVHGSVNGEEGIFLKNVGEWKGKSTKRL